ncbi:MAG: serine hydrolase domain-containing protein [Pseudomonadota bacterium]
MITRRAATIAITVAMSTLALAACDHRTTIGPVSIAAEVDLSEPRLTETELQSKLDAFQAEHPIAPGLAASVIVSNQKAVSTATGVADPTGRPMTVNTPVRIASNTKSFIAAAALRLWEDDRLDLDTPISQLISTTHNDLLVSDGYDTKTITVRHLLMHAGGLDDHFSGDAFKTRILSNPGYNWTRTDQLALLVEATDPIAAPGETFHYSDTGYILLGEIIERITDQPLHEAIRELTKLDKIGLENTWWDEAEPAPVGIPDRAHQWLGGEVNSYPIHGSVDAYGGGGLIANMEELALFYHALFDRAVFVDPATLDLMTTAPGHPEGSPYRIGLFAGEVDGFATYGHGGFWGTDAFIIPEQNITVALVALDQSAIRDLRGMGRELAASLIKKDTVDKDTGDKD